MGIDYLVCANKDCGEGFPDVADYVSCECGKSWCSDLCAKDDGYIEEYCSVGIEIEENECDTGCWECKNFVESTCNYCRSEDFDDKELLKFLLRASNMNREELVSEYRSFRIHNMKEDK